MKNGINLPVVGDGTGPIVVTSNLAAHKTVIATNISGAIHIEASADGVNFQQIGTPMTPANSVQNLKVAASHMRVVASSADAASVTVVAEQGRIRTSILPAPHALNGPGDSINISRFGSVTSFYVGELSGDGPSAAMDVQISGDNSHWAPFQSFHTAGQTTVNLSARYVRAFGKGRRGSITLASEDPSERAVNSPGLAFVFRPGAVAAGNVYTDWETLVNAMSSVQGRKLLEFDDSMAPVVAPSLEPSCVIPAGIWDMQDVTWGGNGPRSNPAVFRTIVDIEEGAVFRNLRMIGGQVTIRNRANITSPISDFGSGKNQVHIGMRDDCGNTQLQNIGNAPLFSIGANSVQFFIQNCLFGVGSTMPLIGQTSPSTPPTGDMCMLMLLGQNQTGENVVAGANGATVVFAALSSSASIAANQTSITNNGGTYSFGPLGRIQRQLVPRTLPAATTSQVIKTPNALVLCDGTVAFNQKLPQIVGGFQILAQTMYTGGQEVAVAEVAGGGELKVEPFQGDSIDGVTDAVAIAPHGSRTFISDGVSNWITIAVVP